MGFVPFYESDGCDKRCRGEDSDEREENPAKARDGLLPTVESSAEVG